MCPQLPDHVWAPATGQSIMQQASDLIKREIIPSKHPLKSYVHRDKNAPFTQASKSRDRKWMLKG